MHELAFAQDILRAVENAAQEHGGSCVSRVRLEVGTYSGIDPDSLSFCLEAISRETVMEGAIIEILQSLPETVCSDCGSLLTEGLLGFVCPTCGKEATAGGSTDIILKEVELDA